MKIKGYTEDETPFEVVIDDSDLDRLLSQKAQAIDPSNKEERHEDEPLAVLATISGQNMSAEIAALAQLCGVTRVMLSLYLDGTKEPYVYVHALRKGGEWTGEDARLIKDPLSSEYAWEDFQSSCFTAADAAETLD